jgi:hypothetical protein
MNEKIRDASTDTEYDGSELWTVNHFSVSKYGSLVIGVLSENYGDWRNYIDFNVIHVITKYINECLLEGKKVILYCKDIDPYKYVYDTVKLKFKNSIEYNSITGDIENIITENDSVGNKAIVITDHTVAFSLKYLIESM